MNRYLKSLVARPYLLVAAVAVILISTTIHAQIKNIYDSSEDDVAGITSLMSAVASNDIDGVRFFSRAGGALVNQRNIGGATALHLACREGNAEIVKVLLEHGADINLTDNEGWTPLMRASLAGQRDIMDLLLAKGANASSINSLGESAIVHATSSNCNECLSLLFEKFNFIENMDISILKSQLADAFVIARNRSNQGAQDMIGAYLDRVAQVAPILEKQKMAAQSQDNGANSSFVVKDAPQKGKKFILKSHKHKSNGKSDDVLKEEVIAPLLEKKDSKAKPMIVKEAATEVKEVDLQPLSGSKFKFIVGEPGKLRKNGASRVKVLKVDSADQAKSEPKESGVANSAGNVESDSGVLYKLHQGPADQIVEQKKEDEVAESAKNSESKEPAVIDTKSDNGVVYKFHQGPAGKLLKVKRKVKKEKVAPVPAQPVATQDAPAVPTAPVTATPAAVAPSASEPVQATPSVPAPQPAPAK